MEDKAHRLKAVVAFLEKMLNTSEVAARPTKSLDLLMNVELLEMMFNKNEPYEAFHKDCIKAFTRLYGSPQDGGLHKLIHVARKAAEGLVAEPLRSQVRNAATENIAKRMIVHHRELFPLILPEAS